MSNNSSAINCTPSEIVDNSEEMTEQDALRILEAVNNLALVAARFLSKEDEELAWEMNSDKAVADRV